MIQALHGAVGVADGCRGLDETEDEQRLVNGLLRHLHSRSLGTFRHRGTPVNKSPIGQMAAALFLCHSNLEQNIDMIRQDEGNEGGAQRNETYIGDETLEPVLNVLHIECVRVVDLSFSFASLLTLSLIRL